MRCDSMPKPPHNGAGAIYRHFKRSFPAPKEGALRVWWVPQIPGEHFHWPVSDLIQASMLLDALAAYDDFQYGENIKPDYSNAGGLEIFTKGSWEEWENDDCECFDDWRKNARLSVAHVR